ncbi:MAG TPA: TRAP transporter large permease [Alphaproteobacteria bacterium]
MSPIEQGFLALGVGILLIGLRVPVGLALAVVSFAGLVAHIGFNSAISLVGRLPYDFAATWEFSAIPMFVLMGTIAYHSGMTTSLYKAARLWVGRLPGGLAVATNFACAGFGAASGSSLATTVAMGKIGIPEMLRFGYHPGLATACCACGGTLAALIPPSIPLLVYGILAEESVAKLFVAGVMPGLLTAAVYAAMVMTRCTVDPALAPPLEERPRWSEKFAALREIWPLPILTIAVMGGIYGGYVSPTEAGAFGAFMAFVIALALRTLTLDILRRSLRDAMVTTATILFVAIGALMLSRYLALVGLPDFIAEAVVGWSLDPMLLILATSAVYLLLGMFLDPLGIMLLTIPVFLPLFKALGYDLVWFGIVVVKFIEIGLLTPPVGLNVFAVKTLVGDTIGLETIFKGVGWFLFAEAIVMTILFAFPGFTLWLPSLM